MSATLRSLSTILAALAVAGCVDLPADHVSAQAQAMPAPQATTSRTTPGLARIALRDLLQRRHLHDRAPVMADLFVDPVPGVSLYEARNLRVGPDALAFDYDADQVVQTNPGWSHTQERRHGTHHVEHQFRNEPYCTGVKGLADRRGRFFSPAGLRAREGLYAWPDARDAQRFCEAWNYLVRHARNPEAEDMLVFGANARGWLERPETRPAAASGWDRQRILAEASYRERNFIRALEHFEEGLRLHPSWAAGWFNAALLYEALEEYEYASNRMRHYLALAPNAPDARQAREKLVVWEDRLRRQRERTP